MTTSTIITMLIGLVLPLAVAAVTKEHLNAKLKALILLLLSTISGTVTSLAGSVPTTLSGWEHVALNILMTFAMAAAADFKAWEPWGTTAAVSRATAKFGIGPSELPKAA